MGVPVQKRLTISEAGSTSDTSMGPSREVKSSCPRREHFMALCQDDSENFAYADWLLFLAASCCHGNSFINSTYILNVCDSH